MRLDATRITCSDAYVTVYDNRIMVGCNLRYRFGRSMRTIIVLTAFQVPGSAIAYGETEPSHHGARLHNAFCAIPTFLNSNIATQGLALIEASGRAVIYIGPEEATGSRAYRDFLMAHECCHHTLGHLQRLKELSQKNAMRCWRSPSSIAALNWTPIAAPARPWRERAA